MNVQSKYLDMPNARVSFAQYDNGTLAVMLSDDEGVEVVSINLVAYDVPKPADNQFYVKNYSEHEGLPFALRDAGIAHMIRPVVYGPYDTAAYLMEVQS